MRRECWHLTEGLIFLHFAVFVLSYTNQASLQPLALIPGAVASRPWTLVTFQFIPQAGMFWFFISMLVLWIMAKPLEDDWGSPRFLLFWLVSTAGAAAAALALGVPMTGDAFFNGSLLFTFATLYPEMQFMLFFIVPVKVKWLGVVGGAFLVFSSFTGYGVVGGLVNVAGMSAGYLFFLATRRLPSRRKLGFELSKKKAKVAAMVETASAEQRNRGWDPRVRAAIGRARDAGTVDPADERLLAELDAARDPSITVCAPTEFGLLDDPVCRTCPGFAECGARAIRMAAEREQPPGGAPAGLAVRGDKR
jgi:membrane associated rhomboid family serine protease